MVREDILEQLVDDYLQFRGYFTRHNVKFRPRPDHPDFELRQDSSHSDVDVVAYNPKARGHNRVWAVSCKSWQAGFVVESKIAELEENKIRSGRPIWKAFRELMEPKWTEAFVDSIEDLTGTRRFTYVTAVTVVRGDRSKWETHPRFQRALGGNPVRLLSFDDMLSEILPQLGHTLVPSQLGRTLQLLKASGFLERS